MAIFPVAAHTFDFHKVYISQRDLAAPGAGTWSNPITIFDGALEPTFATAGTFSSGALTDNPAESRGIFVSANAGMAFLGNGLPDTPVYIPTPPSNSLGYWDTAQGAFTYGGALWIMIYDNNNNVVKVIKSTNSGVTWTEQDPTNGPSGLIADGSKAAIQRVDQYIYVCTCTDNTRVNFAIYQFDMATGLWGTRSAIFNDINFKSFSGNNDEWTNGLIAWPNGDFGVFYSSFNGFPVYRPYTAGTWGSPVQVSSGVLFAQCLINDDLTYAHVFSYPTNQHNSGFLYSTVTQGGTVVQDITSVPSGGNDGVGHCSIQGGMIFVPYDYTADHDNAVWVSNLPVVSFSKELLPVPSGEGGKPPSCAYMMFPNGYSLIPPSNPLAAACPINGGTAQVGVPYTAQLQASGGTPPYTWVQTG